GATDFAGLATGTYYVTLEPGALGADRVLVPELPLAVTVTAGRRLDVEIMVARAARVTGRFERLPQTPAPGVAAYTPAGEPHGVAGAVLELVNGSQRRLATTDAQGRFEIAGLPP